MFVDYGLWATIVAGLVLLGVGIAKSSKSMVYFGIALTICASIITQLPGVAGIAAKIALLGAATTVYIMSKKKDY